MTEMVERIARAISDNLASQAGEPVTLPDDLKLRWLDQGEVDFGQAARAVLEALRDPTEDMVEAANNAVDWGPPGYGDEECPEASPELVWQAMIGEALGK